MKAICDCFLSASCTNTIFKLVSNFCNNSTLRSLRFLSSSTRFRKVLISTCISDMRLLFNCRSSTTRFFSCVTKLIEELTFSKELFNVSILCDNRFSSSIRFCKFFLISVMIGNTACTSLIRLLKVFWSSFSCFSRALSRGFCFFSRSEICF